MRSQVLLAIVMSSSSFAAAAATIEVDQAEVLRLGNSVQHIAGMQAAADDALAALGPPASDADKWFISVVSTKSCAACVRLKQAWRSDPWLLALANPEDPQSSWAHYHEYLLEDRSQAFRWEEVKFAAFPTVLVQPPRTGRYGDPSTIVYQDVYRGDPRKLAEAIGRAIRRQAAKLNVRQPAGVGLQAAADAAVPPPWQPAPKVDAVPTLDFPPLPTPPDDETAPTAWQSLVWQIVAAVLTAVVGYLTGRRSHAVAAVGRSRSSSRTQRAARR